MLSVINVVRQETWRSQLPGSHGESSKVNTDRIQGHYGINRSYKMRPWTPVHHAQPPLLSSSFEVLGSHSEYRRVSSIKEEKSLNKVVKPWRRGSKNSTREGRIATINNTVTTSSIRRSKFNVTKEKLASSRGAAPISKKMALPRLFSCLPALPALPRTDRAQEN
jgi:hypothetical protein